MSDARFVSPVERLMYLSKLPMFATLEPQDLAVLALYAQEKHFARGEVLLREGQPVHSIYTLVSGRVAVSRSGRLVRDFGAGAEVGAMALLGRVEGGVEAVARSSGLALVLGADALYDIFEDHFSILDGVLSATARMLRRERKALGPSGGIREPVHGPVAVPDRPLDLVERMFLLRRTMPFASTSITGLGELAQRCREVRYQAGETLWQAGSPSEHSVLLLAGQVACRSADQQFALGPGDAVGVIDLMAKEPHVHDAIIEEPSVGLALDWDAFADVLEDHFDMGIAALATVARLVVQAFERTAPAAEQAPLRASA